MKRGDSASPDRFTYPSLLKSCSHECRLKEGKMIHGSAVRCGVSDDVFVGSGLIDFYGKCKEIWSARTVFDGMSERNVVSWTAMVFAYVNVGDLVNAEELFRKMPERNLPSWNAMVDGLAKAGDMLKAKLLFDEMPKKDVVSFTAMIDGYAKAGDMASARALFDKAPERDIVVSKICNPEGMSWFSIITTPDPIFTHLAGRTSVWKALSPEVLQAAFNVEPDVEGLFRSKRVAEEIFFPPPK